MIRRSLPLAVTFFALLALAAVWGRAFAQGSGIIDPPETEVVRGVVQIRGTAADPDFWKYELAGAPVGTENWFTLGVSETPVQNGVLGSWDTRTVGDGPYTLRLRVVKRDGNYDEFLVRRVTVGNALPEASPTPLESATPTVTPTAEPPTATPVVLTPDIPTPTPALAVTATPTSAAGPISDGGDDNNGNDGTAGAGVGDLAGQIVSAFLRGARIVLLAALAVGIFFLAKYVLTWAYYRFFAARSDSR